MRPALPRLLLLAAAAVAAGCGEPARPVDDLLRDLRDPDEAVVKAAVEGLGRAGREDRAVVARLVTLLREDREDPTLSRLRLRVDLAGVEPALHARAEVEVARVVQNRLALTGIPAVQVDQVGGGVLYADLRRPEPGTDEAAYLAAVLADLVRPGVLEVLEVVPRPEAGGSGPAGDAAAHDAFAAEEAARFEAARSARTPYRPSRADLRIAPVAVPGTSGAPVVLAASVAGGRMEGPGLQVTPDVRAGRRAVLHLQVAADRADAFRAWTAARVGREAALVLDGVVEATARIEAPAGEHLAFPLPLVSPESDAHALRVARAATGGALRWPVTGEVVPPAPAVGSVLCRALAAVGPAADDAVAELEREGGPATPAARWVREEILRQRVRGGAPGPR